MAKPEPAAATTTAAPPADAPRAWIRKSRWGALVVAFVVGVVAEGSAFVASRNASSELTVAFLVLGAIVLVFGIATVYVL